MNTDQKNTQKVPPTVVVDGAVGVEQTHWYVGIVNNNSERKTAESLTKPVLKGAYECYVPTQLEHRIWKNGRKKDVERVLLPALIFIRCTEQKRKESLQLHLVKSYMVDYTKGTKGRYGIAVVPDDQIQRLKDMLAKSENPVVIEDGHYHLGDRVKVKCGALSGFEGNIIVEPNGAYLVVLLENIGYAKVQIELSEVEKI